MASRLWIADGINHPSAATLAADGAAGWMGYVGTPSSPKNMTAAQYADYKAHKPPLLLLFVYERLTTDISGGGLAGAAHAMAFLQDARRLRIAFTENALAAVDEHVSAANMTKFVAYQRSFRNTLKGLGWKGNIGVYGFSEVIKKAHEEGIADFYVGAGRLADLPPYTNIWQDNTQTVLVGGSHDDKDWIRVPLPSATAPVPTPPKETDVDFNDLVPLNPEPGTVGAAMRSLLAGQTGKWNAGAIAENTYLARQGIDKINGALTTNQAAVLAALTALQQTVDDPAPGFDPVAAGKEAEAAFEAALPAGWKVTVTPA